MPKKPQDSNGLRSGHTSSGPLPRKIHLKRHVHPSLHGSTTSKSQTTEATNREINTGLDNTMWYKHTRERHKPSKKEERMPPAATKKDLARTPGSQASQPEKDQYHTVSLPGGSSKFSHINSLRKETPTHTENPVGFLTDKPQRGFHQESGSSQAHSHTDTYKTNLHENLQERTRNPTHTSGQPRQTGKVPKKTTRTALRT